MKTQHNQPRYTSLPRRRSPRPRLEVEALEDRLVLSWAGVPPATITPPTNAVAITLDNNGDAHSGVRFNSNQEDYYSFVAHASGTYRLSAGAAGSSIDTVLGLFDAIGQRRAYNDDISSSDTDSLVVVTLQAGARYFFGITNYTGTPIGTYFWGVDGPARSSGPRDDAFEENDSIQQAADLGTLTQRRTLPGLVMADSADWFRFTLNAAGTPAAAVAIQFQHAQGDLDVRLYNSSGTLVRLSDGVTNEERVSLDGLAAGTYYVQVFGYEGARNPNYTLDINPSTSSPPPSGGSRVLYLNFDGANLSRADLLRWAGSDWRDSLNDLDPEGDGIRVQSFLTNRNDREQIISRLLTLVQEDLRPFGITVQRHRGLAVENQGATTLFLGPNGLSNAHLACDLDYGNNNRTDIAFIGDETWETAERTALALADTALHEAGHTFGLHHVNTNQNGQIYTESMGLRYTLGRSRLADWVQDTSFQDRTFVAYVDENGNAHGPGPQNSYQTMRRNFGVGGDLVAAPTALIDTSSRGVFGVTTGPAADVVAVRRLAWGAVEVTVNGSAYELGAGLREIRIRTQGDRRDRVLVQGNLGDVRLHISEERAEAVFGQDKVDPRLAAYWNGSQPGSDSDHGRGCGCALCREAVGRTEDFSGTPDREVLGTLVARSGIRQAEGAGAAGATIVVPRVEMLASETLTAADGPVPVPLAEDVVSHFFAHTDHPATEEWLASLDDDLARTLVGAVV